MSTHSPYRSRRNGFAWAVAVAIACATLLNVLVSAEHFQTGPQVSSSDRLARSKQLDAQKRFQNVEYGRFAKVEVLAFGLGFITLFLTLPHISDD
jgi:hypothetical protein